MREQTIIRLLWTLSALLVASTFILTVLGIWVGDDRFSTTAIITFMTAVFTVGGAVAVMSK